MASSPSQPPVARSAPIALRLADAEDLDALVELEQRCFSEDVLSRRSFKRFLSNPQDYIWVAEADGELWGYVLVLTRRGTRLARIYSLAVDEARRGAGLATRLVEAAEREAVARGQVFMRLEVRPDNERAIALYERLGYRHFGHIDDYYEDHAPALRFEKRILFYPAAGEDFPAVPFYAPTTGFTCGPACLMMAIQTLVPSYRPSRIEELRMWREATTIFMTAGHGGCGPHGLALAARERGLQAEIYLNQQGPLFVDSVRDPAKKSVLELVHQDNMERIAVWDVPLHERAITLKDIEAALSENRFPLVLVSTYRLDRTKSPHWVVVSAVDDQFVYIHDPDVDGAHRQTAVDKQYMPIDRQAFTGMMQFGKSALRAAVVISAS